MWTKISDLTPGDKFVSAGEVYTVAEVVMGDPLTASHMYRRQTAAVVDTDGVAHYFRAHRHVKTV